MINPILKKFQSNEVFYFFRGRVALYAILKAMGIQKDDEVILQAFTCLAVPEPIIVLGAKPIYTDIEPATLNLDVSQIEKKITPKTKVIIIQHTYGLAADIKSILKIAQKFKLFVIEDCCHTLASTFANKTVGIFGDAAFYSFEWAKPLVAGFGGGAIINNLQIKKKLTKNYQTYRYPPFRQSSLIRLQYLAHRFFFRPSLFWQLRSLYRQLSQIGIVVGFKSADRKLNNQTDNMLMPISEDYQKRISKWQQSLILKKIDQMPDDFKRRRLITRLYQKNLTKFSCPLSLVSQLNQTVYLKYPLLAQHKNVLLQKAQKARIELTNWFSSPVHPLKEKDWPKVCYQKGSCPIAENTAKKIIALPLHSKITFQEADKIIKFLKNSKKYLL